MKRIFIFLIFINSLTFGQSIDLKKGLVLHYPVLSNSLNDFSNQKNDAILNGEPIFAKDRFGNDNGAVKLTGSKVDFSAKNVELLSSLKTKRAISISAWVYIEDWGNAGIFPIFSKSYNFSKDGFFLWLNPNGFELKEGVGGLSYEFEIKTKKWYHIVANFAYKNDDEIEWGFYLNELGSMSVIQKMGNPNTDDVELYFGKIKRIKDELPEVVYANGLFDEIRIYDRLLDKREIKALFEEEDNSENLLKLTQKRNEIVVSPSNQTNQQAKIDKPLIERTSEIVNVESPTKENGLKPNPEINKLGKYYALIISNNDYQDPKIAKLDKPIEDGTKLYETLITHYVFEKENVRFLKDATYEQMIEVFDYFTNIIKPQDNFLVFYAGHGHWEEARKLGYWLPVDAKEKNKAQWLSNSLIKDYMRTIDSKHTLLIADACFSGSIFKTRAAFQDASMAINKLYELPSRKAMTSGTLKTVPDESMFLKYLVKKLLENQDDYMSSDDLFSRFRLAVTNNSPTTPQYGVIQESGDEGGEFIFVKRK